jgi:PAS domain S-box-containing protein
VDALNQHARRLIERTPDGILISQRSKIVYANAAAADICGAAGPASLHGMPLADILGHDRQTVDRLRKSTDTPFDAVVQRASGATVDVEISAAHLDDEQSDDALLAITIRDVSDRKRAERAVRESEERLRLAFAGAQEGVWDWNLETGAVVYSPRWKQMLGYDENDPAIEPHVRAWERLLHPDDKLRAGEVYDAVARGGMYEGEFRLRHKAGHYINVLSRGYPVRGDADRKIVRIVGTHFDLTERKRAEAERARTELLGRLVFAQEDERRRIAREMHDQFGEQLTALSRAIGGLKASCVSDAGLAAQVEALERIAQRIDRDVDQLVWELRPTALDDLGLRAALANYVQDWSKRVNIQVDLHTTGLLDTRLSSEAETTLYRIAQEALTNVAKHAKATSVDVILERQGEAVLLIIEDNGVGFEADDTAKSEHGFGLLGMQERASLVGASLQIESAAGQGTTILLRMSVNPSASAVDHA